MAESVETSPNANGSGNGSNDKDADPHLEKIGEAAANFFCSEQFSKILGKEIDKRARADKAETAAAATGGSTSPMQMQLSTGKSARKTAKGSEAGEKGKEHDRKKTKSNSDTKKSKDKKAKSRKTKKSTKSAHSSKHYSSSSSSEAESSSSEESSSSSESEDSDSDQSPRKKSAKKSKKGRKRRAKPIVWKKPRYQSTSDCGWKAPDNTNKRRYAALEKIGNGLHAFRSAHVEKDAEEETITAYNSILDGITREMNLIRIAETAEHGWLTVAELEKLPDTNDKKLLKAALKADARLKKRLGGKGRGSQQPFRNGSGGSAAPRPRGNGRQWQKDQPSSGNQSSQQQLGGSQQRGPRPQLRCFSCDQVGHFQRSCPLGKQQK